MSRTRSLSIAMALALLVALLVQAAPAGAGTANILRAKTMVGVPQAFTGSTNASLIRGIPCGGIPWTVGRSPNSTAESCLRCESTTSTVARCIAYISADRFSFSPASWTRRRVGRRPAASRSQVKQANRLATKSRMTADDGVLLPDR